MTRVGIVLVVLASSPIACAEAELTGKEGRSPSEDASSGGSSTEGGAGASSGGASGSSAGGAGGTGGAGGASGAGGAAGAAGSDGGGAAGSGGGGGSGGTGGTGGTSSSGGSGGASGGSGGASGGSGGATGGSGGATGGAPSGGSGGSVGGAPSGGAGGSGGAAASCTDGIKNGAETDTDCGGACAKCGNGKSCASNVDCTSAACAGGKCAWVVQVDPDGKNTFTPAAVTVPVGSTVRWVWLKGGHTVTGGTGCGNYSGWCSPTDASCNSAPNSSQGATYDHTFGTAGVHPYYCRPHCSMMKGTVTVQ